MDQWHVMSPLLCGFLMAYTFLLSFPFVFFLGCTGWWVGGSWSVEVLKSPKLNVSLFACLLCVYTVLSSSINTSNSPLKIRCIVLCPKVKDKLKTNLCGLCF